jgi:Uma2 family endonuclease
MVMTSPAEILATEPIRPLKRVEYETLAAAGCFDDEKVELLFGVVVEMTPIDTTHVASVYHVRRTIERGLADRARVMSQSPFAASDDSMPEPDVFVVPNADYWNEHPTSALLVVEVARTSLRRDRGVKAMLYATCAVDEYWIVDVAGGVVEVYRDRHQGAWRTKTTHARGETIAMRAFPDVVVAVAEILPPLA